MLNKTILFSLGLFLVSCASTPRTKWTDKGMRIMIDPDGIGADHFVRIQNALMRSKRFVVVDRGNAFKAIQKEQERTHVNQANRFNDYEKFAHWGELYGVGGVVSAHVQCYNSWTWYSENVRKECVQYLAIVDTNTSEVIVTAEDRTYGFDIGIAPSWDDIVEKLVDNYPANFEPNKNNARLEYYRELSREKALRQKASQSSTGE